MASQWIVPTDDIQVIDAKDIFAEMAPTYIYQPQSDYDIMIMVDWCTTRA